MEPTNPDRRPLKILLGIVISVILLSVAGLIYWASTGDPVSAPQAPTGEATIPNR